MAIFNIYHQPDDAGDAAEPTESVPFPDELADEDCFVTLTDMTTGEEYDLLNVDNFTYDDEDYCVLVDPEESDDEEISLFFMKYVTEEDGEEVLVGLDEDEDEMIYQVYIAMLDREDDETESTEA
ncbi:MAG: DUF1292 domain-containing protein [Saccharofermentanales bacterium]|jgi:hypothetical protein